MASFDVEGVRRGRCTICGCKKYCRLENSVKCESTSDGFVKCGHSGMMHVSYEFFKLFFFFVAGKFVTHSQRKNRMRLPRPYVYYAIADHYIILKDSLHCFQEELGVCCIESCNCAAFVEAPAEIGTDECVHCTHDRREHEKRRTTPARLDTSTRMNETDAALMEPSLARRFESSASGKYTQY